MMQPVFVPVERWRFKAVVARQQRWTVIHELVLVSLVRERASMSELRERLAIGSQVLTATMARLMRAGLVEIVFDGSKALFSPTIAGGDLIASGVAPQVDEETTLRPVNLLILIPTASILRTRDARFLHPWDLRLQRGVTIPPPSIADRDYKLSDLHDALAEKVILRPNEVVRAIDSLTLDRKPGFVEVRDDGLPNVSPEDGARISEIVATARSGTKVVSKRAERYPDLRSSSQAIPWQPDDVVMGGKSHFELLADVLATAKTRVVILSTFINLENADRVWPLIECAAEQGVTIDIVHGAAGDMAEVHTGNAAVLAKRAAGSQNPTRIHVHQRSVLSHAKFLIADDGKGGSIAVVGSCNWLSTPFGAVELSVILRHPVLVGQIARIAQAIFAPVGVGNGLVSFLGSLSLMGDAKSRSSQRPDGVECAVKIVLANEHDGIVRLAATRAQERLVVGSHRFGSTGEQALLVAAARAAPRVGDVRVVYTQISAPQAKGDVRALREEYEPKGVKFIHLDRSRNRIPIHGKFLLWDSDDAVITSTNWASAVVDADDRTSEIGLHLSGAGVADDILARLEDMVVHVTGDVGQPTKVRSKGTP